MTRRGGALLLAAAGLAGWGWRAHWPELWGLAAGGLVLVLLVVLLTARGPHGTVAVDQSSVRVVRGQPAAVTLSVDVRGPRHWSRVVEGAPARPLRSSRLPRGKASIRMPVDTSHRGQRPVGPYAVVHGDPWGLVRRVVASAEGGTLTVQPRTFPVRRSVTAAFEAGESDSASRRSGDQHFHALRDYVLGDEPRSVHWRSSARAGKLVVRQQVSAAATGTTVVLDVDGSAYGSGSKFGAGWDDELFESAVEVAASLVASQLGRTEQVHLVTTGRGASVTTASVGAANSLLDVLAVVEAVPPADTRPDELPSVVRRTRAAHTIVVTSRPGHRTLPALRRLVQAGRTTVVSVGTAGPAEVPGARLVSVSRPEELGSV
jgi:uncharacterized protein (DUF58 family)